MIATTLLAILSALLYVSSTEVPENHDLSDESEVDEDIESITEAFSLYRDPPGLEEFAIGVGDSSLLQKRPRLDRGNFVYLYLCESDQDYFDNVRAAYSVCKRGCGGQNMEQFRATMKKIFDRRLANLSFILPFVSDYKESEEEGLVTLLNELADRKGFARDELFVWPYIIKCDTKLNTELTQGKKYTMGIIRFELVNASPEKREKLLEQVASMFAPQDLIDLEAFMKEKIDYRYTFGSIDNLFYGHSEPISAVFEYLFGVDGLCQILLSHLDVKTLLYTFRYVSKHFNKIVTRRFIKEQCKDLRSLLHAQAQLYSPILLFHLKQPWNFLFKNVDELLKYYANHIYGTFDKNIPKPWIEEMYDDLQVFEYDNEELNEQFMTNHRILYLNDDAPMDRVVRVVNWIMSSTKPLAEPVYVQEHLAVSLIGKLKDNRAFLDCLTDETGGKLCADGIKIFYGEVLASDLRGWPADTISAAEIAIQSFTKLQITLPFTIEKIVEVDPNQLMALIDLFADTIELLIKIMIALSGKTSQFWSELTAKSIKFTLDKLHARPTMLTKEQLGAIIKSAATAANQARNGKVMRAWNKQQFASAFYVTEDSTNSSDDNNTSYSDDE